MTSYWPIWLPPGNGTWWQGIDFPPGVVSPYTPVFASICETVPGPDGVPIPHAGSAATMRVNNIAPTYDHVDLLIEVDWNWPLPILIFLEIAPEFAIE